MKLIDKILSKNINGFIFDLDGTLINTLNHHVNAFVKAFKALNYKIDVEKIRYNMGRTPWDIPRDIIFNKSLEELTSDEKELINKIAKLKIKFYHEALKNDIPIQPGVIELLEYLKDKSIRLAVCSSTPKINVFYILEKIKMLNYFDEIITGDLVKIGKPNPAAYILAKNRLNLPENKCIIVGDSIYDIIAAKEAKIKCIAVCTGFHNYNELKKLNPDYIIENFTILFKEF